MKSDQSELSARDHTGDSESASIGARCKCRRDQTTASSVSNVWFLRRQEPTARTRISAGCHKIGFVIGSEIGSEGSFDP